jgi:archaemetzincin
MACSGPGDPLERAFTPRGDFAPLPAPGPHDWLANHHEPGQTFAEFVAAAPNLPRGERRRIYLLPVGDFPPGDSPSLELLRAYAAAFFGLEVVALPALPLAELAPSERRNPHDGRRQLLTTDILAALVSRLPPDAYCLIALTMIDLYPDPTWNFVFGQASLRERVGVHSFARYRDDDPSIVVRRSLKVMVHEIGHMFGLQHCIHFSCVMNGSNHLAEADARPLEPCPVCLRKLQHLVGFDVAARYDRLGALHRRLGFADDAAWLARRAAWVRGDQ